MRFAVAALALSLAVPAHAGGLGVLGTAGVHTETVYYHTDHAYLDGAEIELDDPALYPNYDMQQTLSNMGAGFELVLGDRDDRFLGTFRWYYLVDAPQQDPATATTEPGVKSAHVIASYRDTPRQIGMGMVGLSWGFIDLGDTMRLGVSAHVGSGFLTNDHTEFLAVDVAPMFTWRMSRTMQMFVDTPYQMRFRKGASHSFNLFAGVRYMFD